jgi:voltage-gated potassium channel
VFDPHSKPDAGWRRDLYTVLFETETPLGWAFDIGLLVAIVASIVAVAAETLLLEDPANPYLTYGDAYPILFGAVEWVITVVFTVEYVARIVVVRHKVRYALSFFGIVDLLAILPTYLALFVIDATSLQAVRVLRLLRVFRVLKLGKFLREGTVLVRAIRAARYKISVFLFGVLTLVVVQGSLVYAIEGGPETQFTSIPTAVYWAIVTLTTVGYGDIAPETPVGQMVAAMIMLMGYGIIAVPTGIVSVEVARAVEDDADDDDAGSASSSQWRSPLARNCDDCKVEEMDPTANFCRNCGGKLPALHMIEGQ